MKPINNSTPMSHQNGGRVSGYAAAAAAAAPSHQRAIESGYGDYRVRNTPPVNGNSYYTSSQFDADLTIGLGDKPKHKGLDKALGKYGKALMSILFYKRATGAACHEWVKTHLIPMIGKYTDVKPVLDAAHNVIVSIPKENGQRSRTMFTAHTDTVHSGNGIKLGTQKICLDIKKRMLFKQDGECLGADDGTGIIIMLEMIKAKVAGQYIFFADEESGRVGSEAYKRVNLNLKNSYDRSISFDRKGDKDIITKQRGGECCSMKFANELAKQMSANSTLNMAPDPTGSFTDSATFMDEIPECTNVAVGYKNQHGGREQQDLGVLDQVIEAVMGVQWDALPVARDPFVKPVQVSMSYGAKPAAPKKAAPIQSALEMLNALMKPCTETDEVYSMLESEDTNYLLARVLVETYGLTAETLQDDLDGICMGLADQMSVDYDLDFGVNEEELSTIESFNRAQGYF